MDDVSLDGAEWFVFDHDEDLLFFLQVDEVSKPRLLSQSAKRSRDTADSGENLSKTAS